MSNFRRETRLSAPHHRPRRPHTTPHPVASRLDTPPEAVRNPSRGASQTSPRPAQTPVPDVPPPSPEAHARRRQTPRTRPSSPRSARCGTPALPGLARRSEPPSGRCRTAPRDEPRDERGKVARAITHMRACARLYNFFIFYYIYYLFMCITLSHVYIIIIYINI